MPRLPILKYVLGYNVDVGTLFEYEMDVSGTRDERGVFTGDIV
jgi:hypothetical protein